MTNFILKHIGFIAIFSVVLLMGFYLETLWGPIKRRGFHCEDTSIREPFLEDTITETVLYIIGLVLPLTVIILNCIRNRKFAGNLHNLRTSIITFICGFATERFLKNLAKFSVARLRPNFYSICRPITLNGVACEDELYIPYYVENYKCTAPANMGESIFKSFPSGHASLTFYGLMYTVIYLQQITRTQRSTCGPLVPVMQLVCFVLAVIVAVSRVLDFKHFWSDVFAGAVLGSATAVTFSLLRERYMENIKKSQDIEADVEEGPEITDEIGNGIEKPRIAIEILDI